LELIQNMNKEQKSITVVSTDSDFLIKMFNWLNDQEAKPILGDSNPYEEIEKLEKINQV